MPVVKQYHYANISQRRLIELNAFFTALIAGWFLMESVISLSGFFPYSPVFELIMGIVLLSHLTGNLTGKLIFWKIKYSRPLYILAELLFIGVCGFLAFSAYSSKGGTPLLSLYQKSPLLLLLVLFSVPFLTGMKNNYFLKVSCGVFFDEKKGAPGYILASLFGLAAGVIGLLAAHSIGLPVWSAAAALAVCTATLFVISAEYNPTPFFAQEITSSEQPADENTQLRTRDDVFFLYLNFSYILIYTFLGGLLLQRTCGDFLHVKISFAILIIISLCIGYMAAFFFRRFIFPHIYCEIIYPFAFFGYYLLMNSYAGELPYYKAMILFAPLAIIFGATLRHSISCVLSENNQVSAAKALNISIFILPVPILTALSFVNFTQRFFSISVYLLAVTGLIIPGIFLAQKKDNELKKGIYFIFCALAVPFFIVLHLYFSVPFENRPFIERVSGYEKVLKLNYHADYLPQTATVALNNIPVFSANDLTIRSLKRETAVLALFADPESDTILFIDGNRPFFDNPVQPLFTKGMRADYFPRNWTGLVRLPASSAKSLPDISGEMLNSLRSINKPFSVIFDSPNLYDQYANNYRFSSEYYKLIKSRLSGKRIFAQSFDIRHCSRYNFSNALVSFKKEFPNTTAFLFSEQLLILGSDNASSLALTADSMTRMKKITADPAASSLFFTETQSLFHIISTDIADLKTSAEHRSFIANLFPSPKDTGRILSDAVISKYEEGESKALALAPAGGDRTFVSFLDQGLKAYEKQFVLLRKIEKDELLKDYESETNRLLELRKYGEYDPALRLYISGIISFKETEFNEYALTFEKNKQWDDAAKIYRAILIINPGNFNANYRMSVISLTLQDITASFSYLQTAMRLQPDNPNVMHQMGVLLFSTGKYNEALQSLQKAIALKKYDAETYYYIGLCFEELNRFSEALDYYQQALVKDPQNQDVSGALSRLKDKNQKIQDQWKLPEQKNQNDVERGENIPLPINKSAIDVRLKDDPQPQQSQNQ